MDAQPTMGQFLVLGTLEVLLNQALAMHPQGEATLATLAGKVIRIRAYNPDFIFYCLIEREGIELTVDFAGDAQVRVRGSAGNLLYRALLPQGKEQALAAVEPSDIQADGDPETVTALLTALDTFNLWEALRTWIREHIAMPELFGLLRQHDPAWLERLQNLPQLVGETLTELRRQGATQQQLLEEVRAMKVSLRAERRSDILTIILGTVFLALAMMTAMGHLPVFAIPSMHAQNQAWVLVALGLALMLSRLFGRRYE
ncbi:MAG: hypothetical protein ACOY9J_00340 [Pseudomonadota bacterium]